MGKRFVKEPKNTRVSVANCKRIGLQVAKEKEQSACTNVIHFLQVQMNEIDGATVNVVINNVACTRNLNFL